MAKYNLTDNDIQFILNNYKTRSMINLAHDLGVPRRLVNRVLNDHGIYKPKGVDIFTKDVMKLLYQHNINSVDQLRQIFNAPALTQENITKYFKNASYDEVAKVIYEIVLLNAITKAKEKETKNEITV